MAEKSYPGIEEMYQGLEVKPSTFLQLVWIYEAEIKAEQSRASTVQ